MTKETSSGYTPLSIFYRHPKLMQGLSLISGFGILSSGLVVAQTDAPIDTKIAPTTKSTAPTVPAVPEPTARSQPTPTYSTAPEPAVRSQPAPRQTFVAPVAPSRLAPERASYSERKPVAPAPERASYSERKPVAPIAAPETSAPYSSTTVQKKPALSAPDLSPPAASTARPPIIFNPDQIQESAKTPSPTNNYIDRTDYSIGATGKYEAPASVVLTERSSGCQTVSQNGRLASGICGVAAPTQPTASQQTADSRRALPEPPLGGVPRLPAPPIASVQPVNLGFLRLSDTNSTQPQATTNPTYSATLPPVSTDQSYYSRGSSTSTWNPGSNAPTIVATNSPTAVGSAPTGLAYYNLTARPAGFPSIGKNSFMFPLTIPAAITSLFGWRIHPISGEYRFHAGTDLGAPEGTPVIAAVSGQVVAADFLGGYGLTVILQHQQGQDESLYGHLSEIFVKPGDVVEQGNVIGRVGTTGNSTGPHLHFEWRHLTNDGWVAVDAGTHLNYALAQFVRALQVAQAAPQRGF